MTAYPGPGRKVVLPLPALRGLTILERARAAAAAGVAERDIGRLMQALVTHDGSPDDLVTGALLFYAIVWQLERRRDPGLTFDEVQTFDVALDLDALLDDVAEAEAQASVEASIATGLPPDEAGALTLAQLDAYADVRRRQRAATRRRARVHR